MNDYDATMLSLTENAQYHYKGLVTGPYKVHPIDMRMTYRDGGLDVHLSRQGEDMTFRADVLERSDNQATVRSENFSPPFVGDTNVEMVWTATMTESALVGTVDIPLYGVKLELDLSRVEA